MSDIELRNENGKIVGYDSDGNQIPVSFEEGGFGSLDTDDSLTARFARSSFVIPQRDALSRVSNGNLR